MGILSYVDPMNMKVLCGLNSCGHGVAGSGGGGLFSRTCNQIVVS